MRALRILLITSLVVAGAACAGDDDAASPVSTGDPPTGPTSIEPAVTTDPTPTDPTPTDPASTAAPATTPATHASTPVTEPPTSDVRVYFLRGERLVIDHRDVEGPGVLRGALTELLAGPTDDATTAIPAGTALRGVNLADGTATIDVTSELASGGGSLSMLARVGQIVFTATQFDAVERVVIWLDGAPIDALGGEGLDMTRPWTRVDVPRELSGGVLVDTPRPGDTVTSPFVVTGEADVFEAQFPIEVRRGDDVLAVIAPVTGGAWGAWEEFVAEITVDALPGPIDLVAFDPGGCGDEPGCPPIVETVVPLTLS